MVAVEDLYIHDAIKKRQEWRRTWWWTSVGSVTSVAHTISYQNHCRKWCTQSLLNTAASLHLCVRTYCATRQTSYEYTYGIAETFDG